MKLPAFSHLHLPNVFSFHAMEPVLLGAVVVAVVLVAIGLLGQRSVSKRDLSMFGLYGVVGKFGRGKSYFLAFEAYEALHAKSYRAGPAGMIKGPRPVYANFAISGAEEVGNWHDIINAPLGSLVLLDEAHLWWSSRDFAAPVEVNEWITQLRKRDITCMWASQSAGFVARWLRELSFGVWECEKFRRGHRYSLYEPHLVMSKGKNRERTSQIYLVRKRRIMALYDTRRLVGASREWGDGSERGAGLKGPPASRDAGPVSSVRPQLTVVEGGSDA